MIQIKFIINFIIQNIIKCNCHYYHLTNQCTVIFINHDFKCIQNFVGIFTKVGVCLRPSQAHIKKPANAKLLNLCFLMLFLSSIYLFCNFSYISERCYYEFVIFTVFNYNLSFIAAYSKGDLPPQKYFALEGVRGVLSAGSAFRSLQTKEFYGDHFRIPFFRIIISHLT